MTDLMPYTDIRPDVIEGEVTRPAIAPGVPQYVTNPHTFSTAAASVVAFGAVLGTLWTIHADKTHADLAFAGLLASLLLLVVEARRFNDWDQQ